MYSIGIVVGVALVAQSGGVCEEEMSVGVWFGGMSGYSEGVRGHMLGQVRP